MNGHPSAPVAVRLKGHLACDQPGHQIRHAGPGQFEQERFERTREGPWPVTALYQGRVCPDMVQAKGPHISHPGWALDAGDPWPSAK